MAKKQKPKKPPVVKPMTDPPTCPPGYVWDAVLKKCVFDG